MKSKFVAVLIRLDVTPAPAISWLERLKLRGEPSRTDPLHVEVCVGEGFKNELSWRIEIPDDDELLF
jgi:hypothetical protein